MALSGEMSSVCLNPRSYHPELLTTWLAEKPDPFAVATINGEQTRTTAVSKKNLNPYWNEGFDLYVIASIEQSRS